MGLLTIVAIHNDTLHEIERDPAAFGRRVIDAINNQGGMPQGDGSGVKVFPSFHASTPSLFLGYGNGFYSLGYTNEWRKICERKVAHKDILKAAKEVVKDASDVLTRAESTPAKKAVDQPH